MPGLVASVPPGATLPDSSERKPSGISSAAVDDRSTSVSSSFPSLRALSMRASTATADTPLRQASMPITHMLAGSLLLTSTYCFE